MSQYLVAIHHPDDFDPSVVTEATVRDINVLNEEMDAAGVRIFAGGLSAASDPRSLRAQPDGQVLVTDGPYPETKEHIGGFGVLEVADLDEALAWGCKAGVACRTPVEVRAFVPIRPGGAGRRSCGHHGHLGCPVLRVLGEGRESGRREPGQHPCLPVALPGSSKTGNTLN